MSLQDRIRQHSVPLPETGCWIWTAASRGRYGITRVLDRTVGAHRASYEAFRGPIPEGLTIDHLCFVTFCVNPSHLEAVTMHENVRRYSRRAGKTQKPKKLTAQQEAEIRARLAVWRTSSPKALAEEFGVSRQAIYNIAWRSTPKRYTTEDLYEELKRGGSL